jgi:hypothetical protein
MRKEKREPMSSPDAGSSIPFATAFCSCAGSAVWSTRVGRLPKRAECGRVNYCLFRADEIASTGRTKGWEQGTARKPEVAPPPG